MRYISPVVAEANPNLYSAAQRANLSPSERNQIEQMSWAIKKNRELNRMRPEAARQEYDSLDPDVKETLKFFYSNAEYMTEPPTFSDKAVGALKFTGKALASPLISLFKVAGAYNRVINAPYLVTRQIAQGESIFDAKVWSDAWDGKDIYDNGALAEAIDSFGKEKVFVARQLLQGRRPGEILEAYGDLTPGIVNAMTEAFNDPDSFKQVMDATKYAQVSPGRDIARILDNKPPKNGGPAGDYIDGTTKNVSGAIDFMYQIMIDPLTWITGGTSKAITRGTQLAEMATKAMNAGDSSAVAVSRVFQDAGVRKLWDEQLGKDLERLANANNAAERANIRKYIGRRYTGYNNDEAIDFFVRNKMFNAEKAEEIFSDASNTMLLLSGRLDGISFKRNGVATARNQRRLTYGLNKVLDDVFNATTDSRFGLRKTTDELNAKGEEVFKVLSSAGEEIDKAINPAITQLLDVDKDVSLFRKSLLKIGKAAARNPGGQFILIGDNAIKTADTFRQVARQVLSRDLAEFTTQKFLSSSEDEQVVIIRNLYGAIMMRSGLHGNPGGQDFMKEILSKTLNERAGFTTTTKTAISEEVATLLSPYTTRIENGQAQLLRSGAIQPSQLASAIAPLPYEEIASVAYAVKSKQDLIYAIGGATQNRLARNFVDFWSVFTLFPRLGIRSAIDEGFMYALTAPGKDLLDFARGVGRKFGRATTAYTGSQDASPIFTDKFRKLFGRKVPFSEIPLAERNAIINAKMVELNELNQLADDLAITPSEISHITINKEVADRASVFLKRFDADDKAYWAELMIHHPDSLGAMASSVAAKTVSGKLDEPFTTQQINVSELTRALSTTTEKLRAAGKLSEKESLKFGDWKRIEVEELAKADPVYLTAAHYDNWYIRFAVPRQHGALKLEGSYRVAPATAFFQNNALKTTKDLERAVGEIMQSVGIEFVGDAYRIRRAWTGGNDKVAEASVKKFLSYFGDTVTYRQQGLSDEEIVRIYAEGMLLDMRNTFHGTADFSRYNQGLYDSIRDRYDNLAMRTEERGNLKGGVTPTYLEASNLWQKAAASLDIDKFDDLTKDFKLDGFINTRIDFQEFTDLPSIFRTYGDKMMELMDRQLTSILRQPIVGVTYLKYRNMYAGLQREWVEQFVRNEQLANPEKYADKIAREILERRAKVLGQKRFAEIAMNEAVDQVLKYADNPSIRSNFALSVRTVGRFYRATEDFYRRVYRLKDVTPQMLYRMRLAHVGLNASGDIYEDAEGSKYLMMPMDNVIFKATDTTLRALTGQTDSLYRQPLFNDFTLKLEFANPSFSPEAGVPSFSGPIAALGVIGIKNILGNFDNPLVQKTAENIDNFALGDIGDNVTIRRAILPNTLAKLWTMLDPGEKDRQEVTAAQQAVAYNAANGIYLNPNASNQEKAQYLKNIRITAHNILFMRSLLGLISPIAPSVQESQGVPDYLLDVGITGLRPEFFDILESIQKKYGDDVQDPYEMALNIFTGQNPGKIVYTVSRNENQTKVLIKSTNEMKNWALENRKLIKTYGEAAYIFAPRTGEFNASAYNWLQANDLVKDKTLEQYFDDVQVAEDKQRYYDVADWERNNMNTSGSVSQRQYIAATATAAREGLLNSNPLLLAAVTGGGNEIASERTMMETVREMIADPTAPIDSATRTRMQTALQAMDDFISFAESPDVRALYNASTLKREYRDNVRNIISDLGSGDFAVREASRAIFNSILSYYSRDSFKAVP
jgi:hypothetical protein